MKIEYRKGDLLETDIKFIVHGCNAQGVMGSGIALAIKNKYPEAYTRYVDRHKNQPWQLGEIQVVKCSDKVIINAITQEFYGRDGKRYVNYDAVKEVMKRVNDIPKIYKATHIAMPMIGAGLGGGRWDLISYIIETHLTDIQPVVYQL
jgi:O-acetyl-ADP-ribose deacetylase (regulator of RNase III)